MPDFMVDVDIARPRAEVLAWWTGFPDDYRAKDRREQPHRIQVLSRSDDAMDLLTFWRVPLKGELIIPETFRFRENRNFDVDATLPLGLFQHDRFTLTEQDGRTHLHVEFDVHPRAFLGHLTRPLYLTFLRRTFARSFARAGRLCERDAPKLGRG